MLKKVIQFVLKIMLPNDTFLRHLFIIFWQKGITKLDLPISPHITLGLSPRFDVIVHIFREKKTENLSQFRKKSGLTAFTYSLSKFRICTSSLSSSSAFGTEKDGQKTWNLNSKCHKINQVTCWCLQTCILCQKTKMKKYIFFFLEMGRVVFLCFKNWGKIQGFTDYNSWVKTVLHIL